MLLKSEQVVTGLSLKAKNNKQGYKFNVHRVVTGLSLKAKNNFLQVA